MKACFVLALSWYCGRCCINIYWSYSENQSVWIWPSEPIDSSSIPLLHTKKKTNGGLIPWRLLLNCQCIPVTVLQAFFPLLSIKITQNCSVHRTSLWKDCLFWTVGLCLQDGPLLSPGAPWTAWVRGDFAYEDSDCAMCFALFFSLLSFLS